MVQELHTVLIIVLSVLERDMKSEDVSVEDQAWPVVVPYVGELVW